MKRTDSKLIPLTCVEGRRERVNGFECGLLVRCRPARG